MAAPRLRRAFKYPEEDVDGDSDGRDEMDEEEQSTLISQLQSQNSSSNQNLVPLLIALPILSSLPFLYVLFFSGSSTPPSLRLLSSLSLTSLISSVFASGLLSHGPGSRRNEQPVRPSQVFGSPTSSGGVGSDELSPLQRYLPNLNWGLAALIALSGMFLRNEVLTGGPIQEHFWMWCFVPGVIVVVIEVSTKAIADVEDGLVGLGGLKYDYKGA